MHCHVDTVMAVLGLFILCHIDALVKKENNKSSFNENQVIKFSPNDSNILRLKIQGDNSVKDNSSFLDSDMNALLARFTEMEQLIESQRLELLKSNDLIQSQTNVISALKAELMEQKSLVTSNSQKLSLMFEHVAQLNFELTEMKTFRQKNMVDAKSHQMCGNLNGMICDRNHISDINLSNNSQSKSVLVNLTTELKNLSYAVQLLRSEISFISNNSCKAAPKNSLKPESEVHTINSTHPGLAFTPSTEGPLKKVNLQQNGLDGVLTNRFNLTMAEVSALEFIINEMFDMEAIENCSRSSENLKADEVIANASLLDLQNRVTILEQSAVNNRRRADSEIENIENVLRLTMQVSDMKETLDKAVSKQSVFSQVIVRYVRQTDNLVTESTAGLKSLENIRRLNNMVTRVLNSMNALVKPLPLWCKRSGRQLIQINSEPKWVVCFQKDGDLWLAIQQRISRSDFNKTFSEYETGFDDGENLWLGNENLASLTAQKPLKLLISFTDQANKTFTVEYGQFSVHLGPKYTLFVSNFTTADNISDSLSEHNEMHFSTGDHDADKSTKHCGYYYASGWWFSHCLSSNLNGNFANGMVWFDSLSNSWVIARSTRMLLG